jgi:uncharacterized protein GlcG (DUF336 family)
VTALTLADANRLIEAAFAKGAELGCKPLTVAVLDHAGTLLAFQRQAPSGLARADIAMGKARAAMGLGINSRKISEMAEKRPHFIAGVMSASTGGPFIPVAGGVLIADGSGAVGISGDTSDNDEACALAGILAVGRKPAE